MPAGGLLVAGIIGAGTAIYGGVEAAKARKAQQALLAARPTYAASPEEAKIQSLAASQANQGMGAGARQALLNNTNNELGTLSTSAMRSGANPNGIAGLAGNIQGAYDKNALYDDSVRLQNLQNYYSALQRGSANSDKAWDLNQQQPWKDRTAANSQSLQYYNNMMTQGIGTAGSAFAGAARSGANRNTGETNPGPEYISSAPISGLYPVTGTVQQPMQELSSSYMNNFKYTPSFSADDSGGTGAAPSSFNTWGGN